MKLNQRVRALRSHVGLAVFKARRWLTTSPAQRQRDRDGIAFQRMMEANDRDAYEAMYSNPTYVDVYLDDGRLGFYDEVASRVAAHYPGDRATATCLDVGCGTGHLLRALRQNGFGGRLMGSDTAVAAGSQVLAHGEGFEFYPGLISDHEFEGIDVVTCTEVLEHCEDPAGVIHDMLKVVRPGGVIVITVPDGRKDTWDGHIHFWSPESFRLFIGTLHKTASFDYFESTNFCVLHC